MPELGPMMRALELQRLIEDKVSEWRERSARVAGAGIADSYQQSVNFRRHPNRRKNSAEISKIIAKYSKPNKRTDERYVTHQSHHIMPEPPVRPARHKKASNLKFSKSEDNLANIMDRNPDPAAADIRPPPRFNFAKYKTKSCEDITEFYDVNHKRKSKNFEECSILNAKTVPNPKPRLRKLNSIDENMLDVSGFKDSAIELRNEPNFVTSTPVSKRKTYSQGDRSSVSSFQKCVRYAAGGFTLRKGASEPDILSASTSTESVSVPNANTNEARKKWKLLRPQFRKQAFSFLIPWRTKKSSQPKSKIVKPPDRWGYSAAVTSTQT